MTHPFLCATQRLSEEGSRAFAMIFSLGARAREHMVSLHKGAEETPRAGLGRLKS